MAMVTDGDILYHGTSVFTVMCRVFLGVAAE